MINDIGPVGLCHYQTAGTGKTWQMYVAEMMEEGQDPSVRPSVSDTYAMAPNSTGGSSSNDSYYRVQYSACLAWWALHTTWAPT